MIVIFNTNGSIYDAELADYVQQGSNGANRLQVAYVDSARSGLSAYLIAQRPNETTVTLPAHKASFDCNGERYQGWEVTITGSFTLYAGTVHCTLNIVDEDDQIQANYPFDVVVNATGNPIDEDWDERINAAQYNAFMAMLSGKATINRVESKDELPIPGQRSVLWLVGTDKYDAYAWDPESEEYRTILNGIYVVGNIATDDISGLPNGQLIYDENTHTYYEKTAISPYYAKASNGTGVLGAPNILCRSDDDARTIEQLHTIYGNSAYIVLRYLDKDYLYFSKKTNSTYTCVAFDTEEQRFYKASGLSGSALPSTMLVPANKIEIASKAFLLNNYVPYTGANSDIYLAGRYIRGARVDTEHTGEYHDTYKTDDYKEIPNAAFVLKQSTEIENNKIGVEMYNYFLNENATLICGGLVYKKLTETPTDLIYACLNGSIEPITDGTSVTLGRVVTISKIEVSQSHAYTESDLTIDLYSKDQAKAKFAADFTLSIDNTTFVLTAKLKNANGADLATRTIDLPLESIVSSATYYDTYTYDETTYTKVIVITLSTTSVPTIVPVGDLISGLEKEACVEIPVSPTSGTFTSAQMELLALDNASIKIGGYTYLHKVLANQFIAKSAFVSADGYKTESEYKVVVQNNGNYTLTSTTIEFYDKGQIDTKVTNLQGNINTNAKNINGLLISEPSLIDLTLGYGWASAVPTVTNVTKYSATIANGYYIVPQDFVAGDEIDIYVKCDEELNVYISSDYSYNFMISPTNGEFEKHTIKYDANKTPLFMFGNTTHTVNVEIYVVKSGVPLSPRSDINTQNIQKRAEKLVQISDPTDAVNDEAWLCTEDYPSYYGASNWRALKVDVSQYKKIAIYGANTPTMFAAFVTSNNLKISNLNNDDKVYDVPTNAKWLLISGSDGVIPRVFNFDYVTLGVDVSSETNEYGHLYGVGEFDYILKGSNTKDISQYCSMSMFPKMAVIGDSYSSGLVYDENGGIGADYQLSWLTMMARRNGAVGTCYSFGGANTHTWLEDQTHGLPAMLADTPKNLYYIMLGINDSSTVTLGTIADATDDYDNNPDTYYGNYARIIKNVQAHAPNSKIILVCPPMSSYNGAVIDLANKYGLPYITTSDEYFSSQYYILKYGHPVASSYAGMSMAYEKESVKAILNNPTYFNDYVCDGPLP